MQADDLLACALAGTAGRPLPEPDPGTALGRLLAGLEGEPEERLLAAAGIASVRAKAGAEVLTEPEGARCPEDEHPVCSLRAARALGGLLRTGLSPGLAIEGLRALERAGRRLPPSLLVAALDAQAMDLRDAIRPVLGRRGRWLASLRPCWRWAIDATLSQPENGPLAGWSVRWDEGSIDVREAALRELRATHPAEARAGLAACFANEKPDHRARLLAALDVGLGPDDADLLERSLKDRSGKVKLAAADLLSRLPGSELSQRIRARAASFLGRGASGALEVRLPGAFDPAWAKDGLEEQPPRGVGSRAFWLLQHLARVPPTDWMARLAMEGDALFEAASTNELGDLLIEGLTLATLRFGPAEGGDPTLARRLFDHWSARRREEERSRGGWWRPGLLLVTDPLEGLLLAMPAERAADAIGALLGAGVEAEPLAHELLAHLAAPWPEAIARRYLEAIETWVRERGPAEEVPPEHVQAMGRAELAIPPALVPEALEVVRRARETLAPTIGEGTHGERLVLELDGLARTLETRQVFLQEGEGD